MMHMERPNIGLCVGRAGLVVETGWNLTFCIKAVCDHNLFYRGSSLNCPLYHYHSNDEASPMFKSRAHNIGHQFSAALADRLKLNFDKTKGLPDGLKPEDIFQYAYAVFHSPGYRNRYAEFLRIDFPRLPLTGNVKLFTALSGLGGELVALHLMESSELDKPITTYIGAAHPEIEKVWHSGTTVWCDKGKTCGFRGVAEEVWNEWRRSRSRLRRTAHSARKPMY
jgi:predicted helicase